MELFFFLIPTLQADVPHLSWFRCSRQGKKQKIETKRKKRDHKTLITLNLLPAFGKIPFASCTSVKGAENLKIAKRLLSEAAKLTR